MKTKLEKAKFYFTDGMMVTFENETITICQGVRRVEVPNQKPNQGQRRYVPCVSHCLEVLGLEGFIKPNQITTNKLNRDIR